MLPKMSKVLPSGMKKVHLKSMGSQNQPEMAQNMWLPCIKRCNTLTELGCPRVELGVALPGAGDSPAHRRLKSDPQSGRIARGSHCYGRCLQCSDNVVTVSVTTVKYWWQFEEEAERWWKPWMWWWKPPKRVSEVAHQAIPEKLQKLLLSVSSK